MPRTLRALSALLLALVPPCRAAAQPVSLEAAPLLADTTAFPCFS